MMDAEELKETLRLHMRFLRGDDPKGKRADLRYADLRGADLRGAILRFADLWGANLRGADLRFADLRFANLWNANLIDVDFGDLAIPVVEELDARILNAVESPDASLNMANWHTCETTHCRAGWAIHLAGEEGYALERRLTPATAAALIYWRSAGYVPDFYATNEEAIADMRERARWRTGVSR